VHLYQGFASAIFDGRVPYRDFFMEYPPGALPVFLPANVFGAAHYNAAFKTLMALCGIATLVILVWLLGRLAVSPVRLWAAALLFALSPVALGPISLNTYDAWPALLTLAALALLLAGRGAPAFVLLGLAFAAKVYPIVLLPPATVFLWRSGGRRLAIRSLALFGATAAMLIVPFLVLAPHGLVESFRAQAGRALQVESLPGSALAVADRLGIYDATVVHRTGHAISYDLTGSLPHVLALLSSVAQILSVLAVAWLYARGSDLPRRLGFAFAAGLAGFLAFTRFFSPQYLVWLLPFVLLLDLSAWILAAVALVLAQIWFFHYADVFALGGYVWLVFARDLLMVALFVVAFRALRSEPVKDEDPVLLEHQLPLRVPS
jgi:uncharacterized membrane protein